MNRKTTPVVTFSVMKKNIFTLILMAVIASFSISAATKTAESVVSRAVTLIEKAPSLSARISVTQGGQESTGELIISGKKFSVDLPGIKNWFDGKSLWSYSASAGEVNLTEPTAEELAEINPLTYLTAVKSSFTKRLLKSQDAGINVVELTPKTKKGGIKKVVASFSEKSGFPVRFIIYPDGQSAVTIAIKELKQGKLLPVSTFRLQEKLLPGVEVIDLR